MKKRIFSLLTSLIMVISLVAVLPTMTVGAATSGDYEYEILDDGTVEITDYNGSASTLSIPSTLGGKKVTSIGYDAFFDFDSLTNVTIPNSVTSIGFRAFADCSSLTNIKIPNSVKIIDYNAFLGCSKLKSITIPNGVETIAYSTFGECLSLTNIIIPDSVTSIEQWAFEGCSNLKRVIIEKNVKVIGPQAFINCTSLTSVTIPKSVTEIYGAFEGCKSLKDVYYSGSENDWKQIQIYYDDALKNATIHYNVPETVTGFKVSATNASAIKLTWNKVSGADGYIVYRYNTAKKKYGRIAKGGNLAFTDKKLKSGTTYKYAIRAYKNIDGKDVLSPTYPQITATTNPANVSGFKAASVSANAIKLKWNKTSGADGYIVYRYNTSTKKYGRIAKGKNLAFTDKNRKSGTSYKYAIRAYKIVNGKDVLSKSYPQITVSTNPATVSFKVTGGVRKALVQWSKVTGATGYKIYYKTSAKGKWIGLKTTNNKTTSYTKTGLKKGRTYYFAVKAYRTVGGKTYNGAFNTKAVKVK